MSLNLHHFFILTGPSAPQADLLLTLGWSEGSSNRHPGQGTANRRFFFANTTLELLFICDESEARHGPARELYLPERCGTAASPFGLIVENPDSSGKPAFAGWPYCPEYFAEGQCFLVADNSTQFAEPLCICVPDGLQGSKSTSMPENPDWELTHLRINVPVKQASEALLSVAQCDGVSLQLDTPHGLELTFNHQEKGESRDFSPDLPLRVNW